MVPGDSLSLMVMDWIKREFIQRGEGFTCESFVGKVMPRKKMMKLESITRSLVTKKFIFQTHMLYLALDNSLQDCSQLPTGDVGDTSLVQEYKKLSKKPPTPNTQNVRQTSLARIRDLYYKRAKLRRARGTVNFSLPNPAY